MGLKSPSKVSSARLDGSTGISSTELLSTMPPAPLANLKSISNNAIPSHLNNKDISDSGLPAQYAEEVDEKRRGVLSPNNSSYTGADNNIMPPLPTSPFPDDGHSNSKSMVPENNTVSASVSERNFQQQQMSSQPIAMPSFNDRVTHQTDEGRGISNISKKNSMISSPIISSNLPLSSEDVESKSQLQLPDRKDSNDDNTQPIIDSSGFAAGQQKKIRSMPNTLQRNDVDNSSKPGINRSNIPKPAESNASVNGYSNQDNYVDDDWSKRLKDSNVAPIRKQQSEDLSFSEESLMTLPTPANTTSKFEVTSQPLSSNAQRYVKDSTSAYSQQSSSLQIKPPLHRPRHQSSEVLTTTLSTTTSIESESFKYPSRKPDTAPQVSLPFQQLSNNHYFPGTVPLEENDDEVDDSMDNGNQHDFERDGWMDADNFSEQTLAGTMSASDSVCSTPSSILMPGIRMESSQLRINASQPSKPLSLPVKQEFSQYQMQNSQQPHKPLTGDPYDAWTMQIQDEFEDDGMNGAEETKYTSQPNAGHSLVNEGAAIQMVSQMLANKKSSRAVHANVPTQNMSQSTAVNMYPSVSSSSRGLVTMDSVQSFVETPTQRGFPGSYQRQANSANVPHGGFPPTNAHEEDEQEEQQRYVGRLTHQPTQDADSSRRSIGFKPNHNQLIGVDDETFRSDERNRLHYHPTPSSREYGLHQGDISPADAGGISIPRRRHERPPAPSIINPLVPATLSMSPSAELHKSMSFMSGSTHSTHGSPNSSQAIQKFPSNNFAESMEKRVPFGDLTSMEMSKPSSDGVSLQKRQLSGRSRSVPRLHRSDSADIAASAGPPYIMAPVMQSNLQNQSKRNLSPSKLSDSHPSNLPPWVSPMVKPLRSGSPVSPKGDEKTIPPHLQQQQQHQRAANMTKNLSRPYPEWSATPSAIEAVSTVREYHQQQQQEQQRYPRSSHDIEPPSISEKIPGTTTSAKARSTAIASSQEYNRSMRESEEISQVGNMRLDAVYSAAKYLLSTLESDGSIKDPQATNFSAPK